MKHTIKLLTLAFMLATILTLTGCPGPVNTVVPCTHENTRTEVIEEATYNKDGLGKIICVDCEKVIDEQATISRFVAGGYDGDIPAEIENPETYHYQYNKEDDYQIMAYVYSSEEDALNDKNETVLYFSFPNDTTDIPKIDKGENGPEINIGDLIQMKSGYAGKTVKYFNLTSLQYLLEDEYQGDPKLLTNLEKKDSLNRNLPIYIVIG